MNTQKILLLIILTISPLAHADKYKEATWDDLIPAGWVSEAPEDPEFFEGETYDGQLETLPHTDIAPIVKTLDTQKLKLPGYIVPIKFSGSSVSEFLLVPYMGACIHTPPPPENQIVFVSLKAPFTAKDMWSPVWVSGTMKAQTSMTKYGTAGYHMTEALTEVYEY
jgi:hypothetical protein